MGDVANLEVIVEFTGRKSFNDSFEKIHLNMLNIPYIPYKQIHNRLIYRLSIYNTYYLLQ